MEFLRRRRAFITLLGGAAAAWPLAARAQEPGRVYRLGALIPAGRETPAVVAFFDEMRLHGFIEGRNLDVVQGGFNVPRDRIDAMVALIVKAAPDVIISGPDRYTRAFQDARGRDGDIRQELAARELAAPGSRVPPAARQAGTGKISPLFTHHRCGGRAARPRSRMSAAR